MENNAIKDIIKIFSLQEYKNNDMLSSELPDDIPEKKKLLLKDRHVHIVIMAKIKII